MESKILAAIGIDPAFIFIFLLVLIVILFFMVVNVNMKYKRLKSSYSSFMRGRDGKNLEQSILEKFDELDEITEIAKKNRTDIKELFREMQNNYQKVGIVKYDAFDDVGGKLSFACAILNNTNDGFVLNSIHSKEGCYNYIKEIIKGESFLPLGEEEAKALEMAMQYGMGNE